MTGRQHTAQPSPLYPRRTRRSATLWAAWARRASWAPWAPWAAAGVLAATMVLALAPWAPAPPLRAQQAPAADEAEAAVQILTADLARVQTVQQERIAATFLVVGAKAIRSVRINGREEPITADTVVVVNVDLPLPDRENLIEIVAVDVDGGRRDKSYLVIRESGPAPQTVPDRRAAISDLIDRARFEEARVELSVWKLEGGPPDVLRALERLHHERFTIAQSHTVIALLNERRFEDAQRELNGWQAVGGDAITIAGLRQQVLQTKRQALTGRAQGLIVDGKFDEAEAALTEWAAFGDSPRQVAALRQSLAEWRAAPPQFLVVQGIPAESLVQLQVRSLSPAAEGWVPDEGQRVGEIKTLGKGPARYRLPGPGAYTVEFVNEGVHERWLAAVSTRAEHPVVTLAPKLPYIVHGNWERLAALPAPRAAPAVLVREGAIQVLGGYRTLKVEREFQSAATWVPKDRSTYVDPATVATIDPRTGSAAAGSIPAGTLPAGGMVFDVHAIQDWTVLVTGQNRVLLFTDGWQNPQSLSFDLGILYSRPTTARHGDRVFVFGGMELVQTPSTAPELRLNLRQGTVRFDPPTQFFQVMANMPAPRGGTVAATVGDSIYVIGGHDGADFRNDVFRFEPESGRWETLLLPAGYQPRPRAWAVAAVVNDEIYVIGGEDKGPFGNKVLDTVEIFDPNSGRWRQGTALPTARKDAGVAVVDGDIYVIGGHDGGDPLSVVEVLR